MGDRAGKSSSWYWKIKTSLTSSLKGIGGKRTYATDGEGPPELTYYYPDHFPKFSTIKELQEYIAQVEGMLKRYATIVQSQRHQLKTIRRLYLAKLLARKRHPRHFPTTFLTLLIEDLEGDILDSLALEASETPKATVVDIAKAKEVLQKSGIGHGSPLKSHQSPRLVLGLRRESGQGESPEGDSQRPARFYSTINADGGVEATSQGSPLTKSVANSFDGEQRERGPGRDEGEAAEGEEGEEEEEEEERWKVLVDVRERCKRELTARIFDPKSGSEWGNRTTRGKGGLEEILAQERQEKALQAGKEELQPENEELQRIEEENLFRRKRRRSVEMLSIKGVEEEEESANDQSEVVFIVEAEVMEYVDLHDAFEKTVMRRNRLILERVQVLELLDHYLKGKRDPDQLLLEIGKKGTDNFRSDSSLTHINLAVPRRTLLDNLTEVEGILGDFEVLMPDGASESQAPSHPRPALTLESWLKELDVEGRVKNATKAREKIFYGGVDPDLRKEIWKFLLNYMPFDSSASDRERLMAEKRSEYLEWKEKWRTASELPDPQDPQFLQYTEFSRKIVKDVHRTDQNERYYAGENNPRFKEMREVLLAYAFYDSELGYVQGMSDLLSPILVIMENEADTFWCFVGLMKSVRGNFTREQLGLHGQIRELSVILRKADPEFFDHLESEGCGNMFFSFRWLLVLFKREFPFHTVLRLWEVFWSNYLCANFQVYFALAILSHSRTKILKERLPFDEILKFMQECSSALNSEELLWKAEILFWKYSTTPVRERTNREAVE